MKNSAVDKEINLLDLIWDVCLKWRQIIVWAIVFAVLAGGVSYVKSAQNAKAMKEAKEEVSLEDIKLDEEEQLAVERYFEYYRLYENQMYYNRNAPLMQLEPGRFYLGTVSYYVDNHFTLEYPVIDKTNPINGIVQSYESQLSSELFAQKVSEKLGLKEPNELYGIELVDCTNQYGKPIVNDTNILAISVYAPDKETCQTLIQLVKENVQSGKTFVTESFGEHEIVLLEEDCKEASDIQLLEYQQKNLDKISSYDKTLTDMESKMSDNGLSYIEIYEKEMEREIEKTEEPEEAMEPEEPVVGISKKYIAVGFVAGAFLAVFMMALLYLFNNRIRLEDNLEAMFDIKLLGNVVKDEKGKKKWFYFIDKFFCKMRHMNKHYFKEEDAVSMVSAGIKIASKKLGVNKVYATGTNVGEEEKEVIEKLRKELTKSGIELVKGKPILYDAEALESSAEIGCVVFVEHAGDALYREIADEIEICKHQGINVLGAVVVS